MSNNPNEPPHSTSTPPNTPNPALLNDSEIEQRLLKLRSETTRVIVQKDIEERLAKLTNRDPNYYSSTEPPIKIYQMISKQQRMTDTEKTDSLMEQLISELSIDEQYRGDGKKMDEEIERRLALLRSAQIGAQKAGMDSKGQAMFNLDAQPKTAKQLIEQILSEPDHEEDLKMNISSSSEESESDDNDDVEWCSTCNEDGVVKCVDCDDDIYCRTCFRELHTDSDMKRHRTVPYQKPNNKQKSTGKKSKPNKGNS